MVGIWFVQPSHVYNVTKYPLVNVEVLKNRRKYDSLLKSHFSNLGPSQTLCQQSVKRQDEEGIMYFKLLISLQQTQT